MSKRPSTHRSPARFIARTLPGAKPAPYPGFVPPSLPASRPKPPSGLVGPTRSSRPQTPIRNPTRLMGGRSWMLATSSDLTLGVAGTLLRKLRSGTKQSSNCAYPVEVHVRSRSVHAVALAAILTALGLPLPATAQKFNQAIVFGDSNV